MSPGNEKDSTLAIKRRLLDLGERLGFDVKEEDTDTGKPYATRTDVVWYYPIGRLYNIEPFFARFGIHPFDALPLVGFEVEGGDPSSKHQVTNCINLAQRRIPFKFVVTDQRGGSRDRDTYRRLVNIVQTLKAWHGQQLIPLDASHLDAIEQALPLSTPSPLPATHTAGCAALKGRGGEGGRTRAVIQATLDALAETTLDFRRDLRPPLLKPQHRLQTALFQRLPPELQQSDAFAFYLRQRRSMPPARDSDSFESFYYTPALDLAYGFPLPPPLWALLQAVSHAIGPDAWLDPLLACMALDCAEPQDLWQCLFGLEFESLASKHGGAALINLARNATYGIVIAHGDEAKMKEKLDLYQAELGGLGNLRVCGVPPSPGHHAPRNAEVGE
jgi:hypothetical protein